MRALQIVQLVERVTIQPMQPVVHQVQQVAHENNNIFARIFVVNILLQTAFDYTENDICNLKTFLARIKFHFQNL